MGFLPIAMVMLFILMSIILFVFLGGLAMFIVGLVTKIRAKSKKIKKIYPNVLLGLSIPIILIPMLIFTGFVIDFYDQVINKQSDHVVFNEKLEEFFEASDRGDEQAIYNLFSKSAQSAELKQQIEEFLKIYPSHPKIEYTDSVGSGHSNVYGCQDTLMSRFVFSKDSKDYYCYMDYTQRNDSDTDEVGINSFIIESPEVYCDESAEFPEDLGLHINLNDDYDYETARIEGYPHIFTPYNRTITVEQVTEYLKSNDSFDDFKNEFGEPNADDAGYYYELQSVGGEKRYLSMYADNVYDTITSATIVDDAGKYFSRIIKKDMG